MITLRAHFSTRLALKAALLTNFPEGGVFVGGARALSLGTAVSVRVSFDDSRGGELFVDGVVQWRREATAEQPSGLVVRLLASQRDKFAFLSRLAEGLGAGSRRGDVRYPFERPVVLSAVLGTPGGAGATGRFSRRMIHASICDVSSTGALVATPTRLSTAQTHTLDLPINGAIRSLRVEVAWSTDARAGLRIVFERPEHHQAWEKVLAEAVGRQQASM